MSSIPKNNLIEQLALHNTNSTNKGTTAENRKSLGRSFSFKKVRHNEFSSLGFTPQKSSPSTGTTRNQSLLTKSVSDSKSFAVQPHTNSTTSSILRTGSNVPQRFSTTPKKCKPTPPVAFVTPVVSKATPSSNEMKLTSGAVVATPSSNYSEQIRLSPLLNAPGSSLASCQVLSPSTAKHSHYASTSGAFQTDVQLEFDNTRNERISVMDDICELLSDIPPAEITSLFRLSAPHIQRKLAIRKKLLLKEEDLKKHLEARNVSRFLSTSMMTVVGDSGGDSGGGGGGISPQTLSSNSLPMAQSPLVQVTRTSFNSGMSETLSPLNQASNISSHSIMPGFLSPPAQVTRTSSQSNLAGYHGYIPPPDIDVGYDDIIEDFDLMEEESNDWDFNTEDIINITDSSNPMCLSSHPTLPTRSHAYVNTNAPGTKNSFEPPFLPSGSDLNTTKSGKPSMFKPANKVPKDDSSMFRSQYQHTREMNKIFNQIFGLKKFRLNQLEAINAVMLREDCFVLMPTGGGKSLCYQLPALMTPGVTVVVSPLRSLIQDQVLKLTSLGIPAKHLSSDLTHSEVAEVYTSLSHREPVLKLLYVTPEKLGASNKLVSTLQGLHNRYMLARFVIDEAHCISQWGHDFRPDYKKLCELRQKFSDVPIMAVTATATPRVRADILNQLKMKKTCKWFTQSFNRTNLKYFVVPKKPKKVIQDIIELISKSFSGQSGIIYCLSRRDCELVAGELCKHNIAALCYHAGLSNDDRTTVQQRWLQEDRCKVVCATIAFGMGIDKPDVRFVIHHSLPKSVEGYYQEAGRAGRDGLSAQCILFYNYSDMGRLRRMVKSEKLRFDQEKVHMDNLYRMVQYCENVTDCRRVQLLGYFAESFDPSLCKNGSTPCDNCQSSIPFISENVTSLVKIIVESVRHVGNDKYTLNQYLDAIKGSNASKIVNGELGELPLYNQGGKRSRHDLERLLHMLVMEDILCESIKIGNHDNVICYVKLGLKAKDVVSGKIKDIVLNVKSNASTSQASKTTTKTVPKEDKLKSECFKALSALRLSVTTKHNMKNPEYVVSSTSLKAMADLLPTTKEEILSIEGYTEVRWSKFDGEEFLKLTQEYARETMDDVTGKKSGYFREINENQCQPAMGRGKRKKANTSSGPPVKKKAMISFNNNNSDDEFDTPLVPLKLLPHPNH